MLVENVIDSKGKNGTILAELFRCSRVIVLVEDILYIYNKKTGCYVPVDINGLAKEIRSSIEPAVQMKLSASDYKAAYQMLMMTKEIQKDPDQFFLANKPYVCCLNGVVDVKHRKLIAYKPSYGFRHSVQAKYDLNAKCPLWEKYVDQITGGQMDMKLLLQVIIGYLLSAYDNAKCAVLLYSQPHTGKSVLCRVIEMLIGYQNCAHIDLTMLPRQEYAASLKTTIVNIVPDLKNEPIADVGYFKSIVSHDDSIQVRKLYSNPTSFRCRTKMLLSTNHFLEFRPDSDVNDVQAVFNRLIMFEFQNSPIPKDQEDKHMSERLLKERDGIFAWAIEGLRYYIDNGENFPTAKKSLELKYRNMACYCPEQAFCAQYIRKCEEWEEAYLSTEEVRTAFEEYSRRKNFKIRKKLDILYYLETHFGVARDKQRVTTENGVHSIRGYKNLCLVTPENDVDYAEEY